MAIIATLHDGITIDPEITIKGLSPPYIIVNAFTPEAVYTEPRQDQIWPR